MLDPRLLYTQLHERQRELEEQAARDRLAASQRAERHALGRLLTAVGTALLALGARLRDAPAPAREQLSDRRLEEANGHGAQLDAVCQSGALVNVRIPIQSIDPMETTAMRRRSPCMGKQPPAGSE